MVPLAVRVRAVLELNFSSFFHFLTFMSFPYYLDDNDCSTNPCSNGYTCVDGVNSYVCVDDNECSVTGTSAVCTNSPEGACVNTLGGYSCSSCNSGWKGTTCETGE